MSFLKNLFGPPPPRSVQPAPEAPARSGILSGDALKARDKEVAELAKVIETTLRNAKERSAAMVGAPQDVAGALSFQLMLWQTTQSSFIEAMEDPRSFDRARQEIGRPVSRGLLQEAAAECISNYKKALFVPRSMQGYAENLVRLSPEMSSFFSGHLSMQSGPTDSSVASWGTFFAEMENQMLEMIPNRFPEDEDLPLRFHLVFRQITRCYRMQIRNISGL